MKRLFNFLFLLPIWVFPQSNPVAEIINSGSDTLCIGTNLSLSGNSVNPPILAWAWTSSPSSGVVFSPDTFQQNVTISFTQPGTYTISLLVTNSLSTDDTFRIIEVKPNVIPSVILSANPSGAICSGDSLLFTCTSSNQGTLPQYSWFLNQTNLSTTDTFKVIQSLQQNDSVFVFLTSSELCALPNTVSDTFVVQANPLITSTITLQQIPSNVCEGDSVSFLANVLNGGNNPSLIWNLNGVAVASDTLFFSPGVLNSVDEINVILLPDTACLTNSQAFDTLFPFILPKPSISVIQGSDTVCPNDSANFIVSALNGSSFSWTPNLGLNNFQNDTVKAALVLEGNYTYTVTSSLNGCVDSLTIQLNVINQLPLIVSADDTICKGDSVQVVVSGAENYNWSSSQILNCSTCDTFYVSPNSTAQFFVDASLGGCSSRDSLKITVDDPVVAEFSYSELSFDNLVVYSFTNQSVNASSYLWNFGDGSDSLSLVDTNYTYTSSGNYPVTLIAYSSNACPNDTTIKIIELKIESKIEAPNVFSPNGDDINEAFFFITKGITKLNCTIYDRWGVEMAKLPKPSSKWDGRTDSGLEVSEGTYFFVCKAVGFDNKEYNLSGFIKLVR